MITAVLWTVEALSAGAGQLSSEWRSGMRGAAAAFVGLGLLELGGL
jgi:hypothetical protein